MIIDTHIHWPLNVSGSPKMLLDVMDSFNVDFSILSGLEVLYKLPDSCSDWNNRLADLCAKSGGRLMPLATVYLSEGDDAVIEARRCLEELNVKGFKIHPWLQGETLTYPAMREICRIAGEFDVPIMFHDGTPPYSLSSQIGLLAAQFPDTTIILGHSGILHYWVQALEVARQYSNVYLTFCGGHPFAMEQICREISSDKILFGTDYTGPGGETMMDYRIGLVDNLEIANELRKKIMFQNAMELYKIDI